ncbi:hypothetical protein J1N35_002459 [Gossypium stocksii]|uniref:Uncharacterized protein n=1 Tax=Gossypium stocksii TaxID=47602 RepID=A0A9D3WLB9_9ROSI|nr:hypothetical protein J1N35_002459 [Gossypium stocksii]
MGVIPTANFTSSSGLPLYILTHNKWNHGPSYVRLPDKLRDMRLLLNQLSEAEGRTNGNWTKFHAQYINILSNRYEFLHTRQAIVAPKLACHLEYMPWFNVHGKSYLLGEEARG